MKRNVLVSMLGVTTLLFPGVFLWGLPSPAVSQSRAAAAQASPAEHIKSPEQVLQEFCELDLHGKHLTPEGRAEIAPLLAKPETTQLKDILVVMDCVVSEPAINGNRADFYVEQMMLGRLDASLNYIPAVPDHPDEPIMLRRDQSLLLTDQYWKVGPSGESQRIVGPAAWRLDQSFPPSVNVEAAIAYVKRTRERTSDETMKQNANQTLAVLTLLKKARNPYAKKGRSLSDSERQRLYDLFPKQNPCPEIGPMDVLKSSAESKARRIAAAIEGQDAQSILSLTSANGIGFMQLGDQWAHYDDLVLEFSKKTGHYCRFFDTSCLKQPVPSRIAPWLPPHTYSYREWLALSRPYEIDVDLTRASGCTAAIIFVRSGKSSDKSLTKDLYLQLNYGSDGWRLASIGYGLDVP
jgi:hypothetical protein